MPNMMQKNKVNRVIENIEEARDVLWEFRGRMVKSWPLPELLDCLRFALTEAVEAMECALRQNGTYSRNNDRNIEFMDEMADCAFMLISALGPHWDQNLFPLMADSAENGDVQADDVAVAVAMALSQAKLFVAYDTIYSESYSILAEQDESVEADMLLHNMAICHQEMEHLCARTIVDIAMLPSMRLGERVKGRMERIERRIAEKEAQ